MVPCDGRLESRDEIPEPHHHNRYDYSPITARPRFDWPNGNRLAFYVALNVEHFTFGGGLGHTPTTLGPPPDPRNFAWREYGLRVGLWRIADVLDAAGIKATIALNALVCEHYPKAMEEMKKRGWEFMGHGTTNSESLVGLNLEKERETIGLVLKTIEQSTGTKPRGWLGSGLAETYNTLDILAEEGVLYCGDWNADDQPFPMKVKSGRLYSIPYCMEINDIGLYMRKGYTGEQYYRSVMDQFETLYADSEKQPRVMGIPLHPMISGQPLRIK